MNLSQFLYSYIFIVFISCKMQFLIVNNLKETTEMICIWPTNLSFTFGFDEQVLNLQFWCVMLVLGHLLLLK